MNGFQDLDEIAAYRAKVTALLERMDSLHAAGADLMKRHDALMAEHHMEHGCGKKTLLGPAVSQRDQAILGRLLLECEFMEERLENYEKSQSGKSVPVNARAVGNRYRI